MRSGSRPKCKVPNYAIPLDVFTDADHSGTRDNLAGEQRGNHEFHLRGDRERAYYTMAVDRALTEAKALRREIEERSHDRR